MTKQRRRLEGAAVVGLLLATASLGAGEASRAARVDLEPRPDERRVDVAIGGSAFTSYIWPERLAKPVLFPIRTASGATVTRGFPLQPREGERLDHPHQVGLWFNYGDVNGVDFWNNSEARPPEERARLGDIRHVAIHEARGGTNEGRLSVGLEWWLPEGRLALREKAVYSFRGGPGLRSIDRTTKLTAALGRVTFADNKEGLIALRVARSLEEPGGRYTSSEGREGAAVWGTRARWVALAGRIGEEPVVLLLLDHPSNPGHPSYWHARGYGLFAANPLGQAAFSGGRERLNLALEPGQSAVFRHRLLVISGSLTAAAAEAAWREFAAGSRD